MKAVGWKKVAESDILCNKNAKTGGNPRAERGSIPELKEISGLRGVVGEPGVRTLVLCGQTLLCPSPLMIHVWGIRTTWGPI